MSALAEVEWHAWRGLGIGGSDISALLGLSNFSSPWSLWGEKVGLIPPSPESQRQRIGKRMEAVLAAEFHDMTGLWVVGEQTWCHDVTAPHRRCTVDGFVGESESTSIGDALGTIQMKTDGRHGWREGVPANIRAQCVWEMGCTASEHCWLIVMFAGFRIEVFEIAWDAEAEADWAFMCERADRFWTENVLAGNPPEVDGSEATAHALATVWPNEIPGARVELDELAEQLAGREALKASIKAAKAELDRIDNNLKAAMADAEVGTIAGIPAVTLRTVAGSTFTVNRKAYRALKEATAKDKKETRAA